MSSGSQYTPVPSQELSQHEERASGDGEGDEEDPTSRRPGRRLSTRYILLTMALLFLLGIAISLWSILSTSPVPDVQNGHLVQGKNGAVATENKLCSDIGKKLLMEGGSAVDAAIGATLCIGTVNMYSSGIGGGGFALVRSKNGAYETFDFREEAPASAFTDMYHKDPSKAQDTGTSVAIP